MDTCLKEPKSRELKTPAYVLRRTNYGEADRIINFITPSGKISAMAKGVRKPRSKLAGGVEMFTLSEINLHFGKGELATLTGARMTKFHAGILKDFAAMEAASEFLKEINRASETVDSPEFFDILDRCLMALCGGVKLDLTRAWFYLNLARAMGEQINLYTDASGNKLEVEAKYRWNEQEMSLEICAEGPIDADTIKMMRLMWTTELAVACRVKNVDEYLPEILKIAYAVKKVVK